MLYECLNCSEQWQLENQSMSGTNEEIHYSFYCKKCGARYELTYWPPKRRTVQEVKEEEKFDVPF